MSALTHPQPRNELGQFAEVPTFTELNRYWAEPAFRSAMDTERSAKRAVIAIEQDRSQIARFVGNDVPGWVHAARERVSAFDRDYGLLIMAGRSHEEATEIAARGAA
jgi:hypothetical protein